MASNQVKIFFGLSMVFSASLAACSDQIVDRMFQTEATRVLWHKVQDIRAHGLPESGSTYPDTHYMRFRA